MGVPKCRALCTLVLSFDIAGSLFTVMVDLPLSIHSLAGNSISDEGVTTLSEAIKKMTNLQWL